MVQADPTVHSRAARTEGEITGDAELRRRGLWRKWHQNGQLAGTHTGLSVQVLGIFNHAFSEHRLNWDLTTELAPAGNQAVVCSTAPTALAGRPRIKRRLNFVLVESGGIVLLHQLLTAYTRLGGTQPRNKFRERLSTIVRLQRVATRGVKVASRSLLAEVRSAGNAEISATLVANFRRKTTLWSPQRLRRRRWRRWCWRVPPKYTKEMLLRGARTTSTPPRCSSIL